ncbi:hypothetical protein PENTCL1PPCAC_4727, partial [Pristionchus entomophagus]
HHRLGVEEGAEEKPSICARSLIPFVLRRLSSGMKGTRRLRHLPSKERSRILKASGVKIDKKILWLSEHELIRRGRRECGCKCEDGRCLPETCECSRNGIACQVDTADEPFPCRCSADSCQNDRGRVEFNHQRVQLHRQATLARLRMNEKRFPLHTAMIMAYLVVRILLGHAYLRLALSSGMNHAPFAFTYWVGATVGWLMGAHAQQSHNARLHGRSKKRRVASEKEVKKNEQKSK